ncbi:MAG: AMP-binding protein [Gemmatimonadetes bacterium]|nr:AMP-binding protein [Gemmatimonadota bacterium]
MTLLALYDRALVGRADAPALTFEDDEGALHHDTFGTLDARSTQCAAELVARGVRAGDRLALWLANSPAFIDLWLACVKLGVIVVPINVLYRERELSHIVHDAAPVAVVTTVAQASLLPAGTTWWDVGTLRAAAAAHDTARDALPAVRCTADTPAALVYTSGTTGASKGAILTHGNFAANGLQLVQQWELTQGDRYLCPLPLFHVHGLGNGLHCWLFSGCHCTLVSRFAHDRAAALFARHRPTVLFGVPTMYVRLLDLPADAARAIGSAARLFVCGSAPLPAAVLDAFAERFGHTILERYGMTETLMNTANPFRGVRRAGTVGMPMPLTALRVVDDAGRDVPDGTSGEVWVRGPSVCAGYWQRPDATAQAFTDGWFRTGDIGVRDAQGYLTLEGRRSDLIISAGFNIYPREVEELLLTLPGVREAAVIGVPDAVRGEVPVAYIVSDDAAVPATLETAVRSQLASFKVPRAFVRVDALPRTALGKVQRHLLPPYTP